MNNLKFDGMKKFLLVVIAMVTLGSVHAQTAFKSKVEGITGTEFYFGPKFGFNVVPYGPNGAWAISWR